MKSNITTPNILKATLFTLVISLKATPLYAVINGAAANDARYNAVGALKTDIHDSVACTATLIAPNWIVTADHCIHAVHGSEEEGGEPLAPEEYEFRLGNDFKKAFFKSKLKRWVSGPEINGETLDIAFGELKSPVDLKKFKLNVIPVRSQSWSTSDLNSFYVHIGYGVGDPFSSETSLLTNKRQQALFKVTASHGNAFLNIFKTPERFGSYIQKFHPEALEAAELETIFGGGELTPSSVHAWDARGRTDLTKIQQPTTGWQDTCFGDSGGPLIREEGNKISIVGVVSQGMDRICSTFGTKFIVFGPEVRALMQSLGIEKAP